MIPDYELFHAVKDNHPDEMKAAIEKGANIHMTDSGMGLLEHAQRFESPDAARLLIELGLDVNQRIGRIGDTLLHKCARQGDGGFAYILLEAGADANAQNKQGKTPLDLSDKNQYFSDMLRRYGATKTQLALG